MASSSSRPPWIVSTLAISRRLLPEAITHRDRENPSILAVDPSAGILLVHVILRRASASAPIVVDLPGQSRYVLPTGFVASYLVVDTTTNTLHPLPHPGILKESARVGILYSPSGFCRYVVAELQLADGSSGAFLRYFDSHDRQWHRKRVRLPIPPGRFNPDCVLSHNVRLCHDTATSRPHAPASRLVAGPSSPKPAAFPNMVAVWPSNHGCPTYSSFPYCTRKAFNCSRAQAPDLHRHRCVRVSDGKLRFVDMGSNNIDRCGIRKVTVWTLRADEDSTSTSTEWLLEYEASFEKIWSDRSYKDKRLNRRVPVLAFIHPTKPWIVYFFLDKKLFGINLLGRRPALVECSDYEPVVPSSDRVSSRFFHVWKLEQQQPNSTSSDSKPEGNAGGANPDFVQGYEKKYIR
ncbi:unnamed protein product [Urochloa decumbens]|uniref:DUF1618 domain-containing protein n=1 Tax=Urochloa decumbens TaxID=240449 RepID=A0ABC8Z1T5_9POAL